MIRTIALVAGFASIVWVVVDEGVNTALLVLWSLIATRGVWKSLSVLRRVFVERRGAVTRKDRGLILISSGNVRRTAMMALALLAFLYIAVSTLFAFSSSTVNRALIIVILLLLSVNSDLDEDEINRFDKLEKSIERHRVAHHVPVEGATNVRQD